MKSFFSLLAAGSLLATSATAQTPKYAVIDLGPVGGPPGQPLFITDNGLISGAAAAANGSQHATLWYPVLGFKMDIGAPGLKGPNSLAYVANEKGQVVGMAQTSTPEPNGEDFCGFKALGLTSSGTCKPFIWYAGVMTPLPTLGGNNGTASWINNRGEIAGWAENAVRDPGCPAPQLFQFKPALWNKGAVQELTTYPGDPDGVAISINDNGDVAGGSGTCSVFSQAFLTNLVPAHALLWQRGSPLDLGNLGGSGSFAGNIALALNNRGQVVGQSDLGDNARSHAFMWTKHTGIKDLGALPGDLISAGLGINDAGDVVGLSLDAEFNLRAFLVRDGTMSDLNKLIRADSPWALLIAVSVNSSGAITGLAARKSDGEMHAFVAAPMSRLSHQESEVLAAPEGVAPTHLSDHARTELREKVRSGQLGRFVRRRTAEQ